MANHLKMAQINAIKALREHGWSCRRIARELGVHRETVGRYVRAGPEAGNPPTGAEPGDQIGAGQNRPNPPTGASGPSSLCEPWRASIEAGLQQGLSAQRIWQDLRRDNGFAGGYDSVKRFCRHLRRTAALPYRRMECEPGAEAQVDFGTGAPIVDAAPVTDRPGHDAPRHRRRTYVLRVVLSHSRKAYSEVVYHQTTDEFLRCLENAFWFFGGVPVTLVLDNLRAAVSRADWFDPELNPKVQSFCAHYRITALPTKPRMPRHKGKIERGIGYVQSNALKGRTFRSLAEQNEHLRRWEAGVADRRIHGTTKRQVQQVFAEVEQPALQPLAATRFPSFQEGRRVVNRDGHVEVAKAYYSAPPEYLGRRLWVRWDSHLVRLFDSRMRLIAIHPRQEEGRFSTQDQHLHPHKINRIEHGAAWLLKKAQSFGPGAGRWAEAMLQVRGIAGVRVLQGLVALTHQHAPARIDRACQIAVSHQAFRLRTIRTLVRREVGAEAGQEVLPGGAFLDEHPIIRSLDDYGDLVRQAVNPSLS